jgi:hypothetical protein
MKFEVEQEENAYIQSVMLNLKFPPRGSGASTWQQAFP